MVKDEEKLKQIVELLNFVAKTEKADNETKPYNILTLLNDDALKTYLDRKNTIIDTYDLNKTDKFNIFETISDIYYVENFHTDILFSILNPNTPEIGPIRNKEILDNFVATIANDDSFKFKTDGTVNVSKQVYNVVDDKEGFIDLLITNDSRQAIIIENKINDAPDMENQLVRYMKYVWEEKFGKENISLNPEDFKKNVRVVYLTLIPNGKRPNIDDYAPSFSPYTKLLEDAKNGQDGDILKYRSAVDSDNTKDDLEKFLQKCIEGLADKCSLKKIYLEQYQILLKHLGGKAKMSELGNKVIEKIYSNPTLLQAAKDLYEILEPPKPDCRADPAGVDNYINKLLLSFLEEHNFKSYKKSDVYPVLWDTKEKDYLYACGQYWNLQIGFGTKSPGTISGSDQEKYKGILKKIFLANETVDGKPKVTTENEWVYVEIEPIIEEGSTMVKFLNSYKEKILETKEQFLNS